MIKIKDGVNLEILRDFGFKTGKDWANQGERCFRGIGYEYQYNWYHKFLMDEDTNKILYIDDEYDIPVASIAIRVGRNFKNDLYISCSPSGTYHISGDEMDIIAETILDLAKADIIEKVSKN